MFVKAGSRLVNAGRIDHIETSRSQGEGTVCVVWFGRDSLTLTGWQADELLKAVDGLTRRPSPEG